MSTSQSDSAEPQFNMMFMRVYKYLVTKNSGARHKKPLDSNILGEHAR